LRWLLVTRLWFGNARRIGTDNRTAVVTSRVGGLLWNGVLDGLRE
jgi:hypothetical protein